MANTDQRQQPKDSPLFLVRLWADPDAIDAGEDPQPQGGESLGKVLHVVSGEAHSFNSWAELVSLMQAMISGGQDTQDIDQPTVPVTAARESRRSC